MEKKFTIQTNYSVKNAENLDNYIRFWLNYHIQKKANYEKWDNNNSIVIEPDFETQLWKDILEDILDRFTSTELLIIFNFRLDYNFMNDPKYLRRRAIENLNNKSSLNWSIKEELKRKVWSLPPNYFKLIYQLIEESEVCYCSKIHKNGNSLKYL